MGNSICEQEDIFVILYEIIRTYIANQENDEKDEIFKIEDEFLLW